MPEDDGAEYGIGDSDGLNEQLRGEASLGWSLQCSEGKRAISAAQRTWRAGTVDDIEIRPTAASRDAVRRGRCVAQTLLATVAPAKRFRGGGISNVRAVTVCGPDGQFRQVAL